MKKIIILIATGIILSILFLGGGYYFIFVREPSEKIEVLDTYEYDLGTYTSNLGDTRNFFQGHIIVEVTDEDLLDDIEDNIFKINDAIIGVIISKRPNDLLTPMGKNDLKNEIIEELKNILNTEHISDLYFADYIVQ